MPKRSILRHDQAESFGQRIARLRKEHGITQEQLAVLLKVSQSNVSDYERDNLRLHADILVALTKILEISADELLGTDASRRSAPIKDGRLARRLRLIDQLPKRDKDALMRTINAFLERSSSKAA